MQAGILLNTLMRLLLHTGKGKSCCSPVLLVFGQRDPGIIPRVKSLSYQTRRFMRTESDENRAGEYGMRGGLTSVTTLVGLISFEEAVVGVAA